MTDNYLPYSFFQVEYKKGNEEEDHIKIDLYSEGMTSNMERRSMIFFKDADVENYKFFVRRYEFTRNVEKSNRIIAECHDKWCAEWERLKEVLNNGK